MDIITNLIPALESVMYKAGDLAVDKQAGIANITKDSKGMDGEDEFARRRRTAKTEIDVEVQEILLKEVARVSDPSKIYLDAEESSPSKNFFSQSPTDLTLIIDPIDGTLEYIEQSDVYCITVGLARNNKVEAALIYFPKRRLFYSLKDNKALIKIDKQEVLLQSPKTIKDKKVYVNNRVPETVLKQLQSQGFKITGDRHVKWPDALIGCINGEYVICLFDTPQMRDVLLGALITALPGGYAKDWEGKNINWPNGGRIPQVAFGFGDLLQVNGVYPRAQSVVDGLEGSIRISKHYKGKDIEFIIKDAKQKYFAAKK